MRSARAMMLMLVCASLVLLLSTCIDLGNDPNIEFVVPDGFHGVFVIKHDELAGTPPERSGNLIRYKIPKSGVLKTSDIEPLRVWHSESARYASGKKVPQLTGDPGEQRILYALDTDDRGQRAWLIGTKADAGKYWKDRVVWFEIESAAE